jgi:hypothetical protein
MVVAVVSPDVISTFLLTHQEIKRTVSACSFPVEADRLAAASERKHLATRRLG